MNKTIEQEKKVYETLLKILERIKKENVSYADRMSMFMDLNVARKEFNMDLDQLLNFDSFNFIHDVLGIARNINRNTKRIKNCFLPRCAKENILNKAL